MEMKPTSQIKLRLGIEKNGRVQKYLIKRTADYMDKYVPMRDGMLRANIEVGPDYVIYKSPYAHYQYKGILYVDPDTGSSWATKGSTKVPTSKKLNHVAGTGSNWDKRMMTAEGDDLVAEIQKYIGGTK